MSEIDRKNLTILVVEDNEDTRYLMRLALEALGYRVCEAEDGEQAIDMACREQPNAILMDISMPVLNGLTATARIREHDELRTIPIVAVTAHHEVELRDGAQACGFTAYVTKPIDFKWLDELIRSLIV
jgi:two-component system cell cycle response regulator DivK